MNQIDKVLDSIDMVDDVTLEYSFNIVDSLFMKAMICHHLLYSKKERSWMMLKDRVKVKGH